LQKPIPPSHPVDRLVPPDTNYRYFENALEHPFFFNAREFQLRNAWWLMEAAFLVYVNDEDFVKQQLHQAGLPEFKFFNREGTQCFVAFNQNFIIAAFRGTELKFTKEFLFDAAADINIRQVNSGRSGKVHSGFKKALDIIWDDFSAYLNEIRKKYHFQQTVWFTGHSLGGALATLAADRFGEIQGLYVFGCPRVGDKNFRKHFPLPETSFRIDNKSDIITKLPPAWGYYHVGKLKYINGERKLRDNPSYWERIKDETRWGYFRLRYVFRQWNLDGFLQSIFGFLVDHAPLYYAIFIWNAYEKEMENSR
jgi:hypothetical protein